MDVNLQAFENFDLLDSQRAIFNVLRATLEYPTDPQVKCTKLVDDIEFFCKGVEGSKDRGLLLDDLWTIIIEVVRLIPSDHSWQDILLDSLKSLHQRGGPFLENDESGSLWHLDGIWMWVMKEFNDDPFADDNPPSEELAKWKNFHSFIARLMIAVDAGEIHCPIWQIRETLEESLFTGPEMECQLWVSSEWIKHCADFIFQAMNPTDEVGEDMARSLKTGSLCRDIPPLSVKRWDFWKKRFSELAADADNLELGSAITVRISEALKRMDAVTPSEVEVNGSSSARPL